MTVYENPYRKAPQLALGFDDLVVDNFCGGGGASLGIEAALGRSVDIAINHDQTAISLHTVNHPQTRHYRDDVWQVDPREVCGGRPVGLAWFSPDCRHHSKARGSKPVSKSVRGLAWVVLKWAGLVRPRVIMLENVEEFADWGPLTRGKRPCPRRRGMIFERFVSQLRALGYSVDRRQLRACDYGAPTIRKRLFLVARCDGQPIVWPEPTHGPDRASPFRTAAEVIDWSLPCPSIFTRRRPLADKTLTRIARGLDRFVIGSPQPFLVPAHSEEGRSQRAQTAAFLAKHYGGVVGHGGERPLGTITQKDHHSLVTAHLAKAGCAGDGTRASAVRAFLLKYYGTNVGQSLHEPLQTITSKARFGLVTVAGTDYELVDIGMRMLQPHELYAAQGFSPDYIHDRDAEGNAITLTEQTAKCGNSVPPPVVAALVRANVDIGAALDLERIAC